MINSKISIKLNVDRTQAEELYDEIEGYLSICFESIIEQRIHNKTFLNSNSDIALLQRIITPATITGFLIEKLKNKELSVSYVGIYLSLFDYNFNFEVLIQVPNIWAMEYGKSSVDYDLQDTIDFFTKPESVEPTRVQAKATPNIQLLSSIFNGVPVNPIIGSLYYDDLSSKMKCWSGTEWINHIAHSKDYV